MTACPSSCVERSRAARRAARPGCRRRPRRARGRRAISAAASRSSPPAPRARRRAGRPRRRPRRSGGRRRRGRAISCCDRRATPVLRQELLDEPALALVGHRSRRRPCRRPRGRGRRPRPRSSAIARCFSASISAAARSRRRSSSSRVAAMSASRVSWATFWARARISFASRRASLQGRRAAPAPRSRGRDAPARRP